MHRIFCPNSWWDSSYNLKLYFCLTFCEGHLDASTSSSSWCEHNGPVWFSHTVTLYFHPIRMKGGAIKRAMKNVSRLEKELMVITNYGTWAIDFVFRLGWYYIQTRSHISADGADQIIKVSQFESAIHFSTHPGHWALSDPLLLDVRGFKKVQEVNAHVHWSSSQQASVVWLKPYRASLIAQLQTCSARAHAVDP